MGKQIKDFWDRYHKMLLVLLSSFALFTAIARPMVWPSKIQHDIEKLQNEDAIIKDFLASKADKVKVEADQALLKKDMDFLKEKLEKLDRMVEHLYLRSGGRPIQGGN